MNDMSPEQSELKKNTLTIKGRLEPTYLTPETGMVISREWQGIILDLEAENIKPLIQYAQELALKPNTVPEKIHEIIQKTHQILRYPFKETVKNIQDEEAKKWIEHVNNGNRPPIKLSEIVQKGYGICNEFATLAWVLSSYAGIKTSIINGDVINNNIFKASPQGETVPHVWCEYLDTKKQEWLPFDPTTRIEPVSLTLFNQSYQPMIPALPKNVEVKGSGGCFSRIKQLLAYPRSELGTVDMEIFTSPDAELIIKNPPIKFLAQEEVIQSGMRQFRIFVPEKNNTPNH